MFDLLHDLMGQKNMISIYTDVRDTTKFVFGKLLLLNDNEFAIYMISPDGMYDGILVKNINSVIKIETGGQYVEKMNKLCLKNSLPIIENLSENESIFKTILSMAIKTKEIVSIELVDSGINDVVGFVEKIENQICKIKLLDEYGYDDGFSYVLISDITQISYASQDEKRILFLFGQNKKTGDGSLS